MKSVLVIGLGTFGTFAAKKYATLGNHVMAIDINEEPVNDIAPFVQSAQIADCTKEEFLRSIGVRDFDICLVAIGRNFQASLEITSLLKDLGAEYVISKTTRDIQAKFLLRNGADRVVYPDKDLGEHIAICTSTNVISDFIELSDEVAIYEMQVPEPWVGKTIVQLAIRSKYSVNVLAVKSNGRVSAMPDANYVFQDGENIVVLGSNKDIKKILSSK